MLTSIHFTKIFRQHRVQKFRVLDLRQGITNDMFHSLKHLISERGFDSFRDGLEARFKANHLSFRIHYSENSPLASLLVRLESAERVGEVCVWESGHCDITAASLADGKIKDQHVVLETAEDFHGQLAALFLFVTKRADNLKPEWPQKFNARPVRPQQESSFFLGWRAYCLRCFRDAGRQEPRPPGKILPPAQALMCS